MPQQKINFKGALLDSRQPEILRNRMARVEWEHFVREINLAIYDAQVTMKASPYIILVVIFVAIMLVMLDMALNGIFGNPQAGTVTLTIFVLIGVLCICYISMGKPTKTCEECVEQICEHYSDAEREIYFFYRHHAQTRITENRFYIEVFVAAGPEEPQMPRKMAVGDDIERGLALVPVHEERQLALVGTESTELVPLSTALTIATAPTEDTDFLSLVPVQEDQALVPMETPPPDQAKALVPMDARSVETADTDRAIVPTLAPAPAPIPYPRSVVPTPEPTDALVPAASTRGSIAPPPTHEDMSHAFSAPPPETQEESVALVPADAAASAPPPSGGALVPRRQVFPKNTPRSSQAQVMSPQQLLLQLEGGQGEEAPLETTEELNLEQDSNTLALEHGENTNELQQQQQAQLQLMQGQGQDMDDEMAAALARARDSNAAATSTTLLQLEGGQGQEALLETPEELHLEQDSNTLALEHGENTNELQQQQQAQPQLTQGQGEDMDDDMATALAWARDSNAAATTQSIVPVHQEEGQQRSQWWAQGQEQEVQELQDTTEELLLEHDTNALVLEHAQNTNEQLQLTQGLGEEFQDEEEGDDDEGTSLVPMHKQYSL